MEGAGSVDYTKSEEEWRLYVYTESVASLWIGGIYAVKPDKANLIIVDDGPYKSFYDNAYLPLKALGVPVTWAGDWSFIGDPEKPNVITAEDLAVIAADGFSEFSFHNYDGTLQDEEHGGTAMTALTDTVKNIRYLQKNGLQPKHIWRAAWQGNNCSFPELANEELEASATPDGTYGVVQFPWPERHNIPRLAMQDRNAAFITTLFGKLQHQHCTVFLYTHGIVDSEQDDKHVTLALLALYLDAIEDGIESGWLNATTYSRLVEHYRRIV